MAYKLICTLDFGAFKKGQEITDPHLIDALLPDREHHFVRVSIPDPAPPPEIEAAPVAG